MAGDLSHERETGTRRRIDLRQQFGWRHADSADYIRRPAEVRSLCVDFAQSSLILNEIESAGELHG